MRANGTLQRERAGPGSGSIGPPDGVPGRRVGGRRRMRDDADRPEPPGSGSSLLPPWAASDRFVPRTVLRPLQEFLQTSIAGGVLLLAAVIVALLWVNSPWDAAYDTLWHTEFTVKIGTFVDLTKDL